MPAYLIVYGADPTDRLAAYAYATRSAAWEASLPKSGLVPRVPPDGLAGGCAYVIERAEDVPFSGTQLIAVFNGLAGPDIHVNRFESRTVGVQRLLALLSTLEQECVVMPDTTNGQARGRKMKYVASEATIRTVAPNPYREGSKRHAAYALYRVGMTAADFLAAGGKTYDINRALNDGHITVA